MTRRDERNSLADEDRDDVDVEFVDLAGVQERGDQLSAAHHPDLLARGCAQAPGRFTGSVTNSMPGGAVSRLAREDVVSELRVEQPLGLAVLLE
jgi:hypothetical protein